MSNIQDKPETKLVTQSYAVEVIADNSGKWCGNRVRYASHAQAEDAAVDHAGRWTAVRGWRVVASLDEPNQEWREEAVSPGYDNPLA